MLNLRWRALGAIGILVLAASALGAQGITTGAIGGTVMDATGKPVPNAQVEVRNASTGFITGGITRDNGRYLVQGLEVGAGYMVTARRIGFTQQRQPDVVVTLSQTTTLDFKLDLQVTQLVAISITAYQLGFEASNTGTKATVNDTVLQRQPTQNRNLTDFIRLVPQVSVSGPGYSAGGMSNRMNNVQIDGATERDIFGLGSTGQPGGQISAKSISIDAVKELQVLLAPFDVRQGNFGGLLLNAVTKSGSNEFHGSVFSDYRNERYGRNTPVLRSTKFDRGQYVASLGGPIIQDKLHFFVNTEVRQENAPLFGPYLGQPANATSPLGVATADLTRYEQIMTSTYGRTDIGTAAQVNTPRPQTNAFGRIDWKVNDVHRVVFRYNYGSAEHQYRTQNDRSSSRMVYTDNEHTIKHSKNAPVVQIYSNFANGGYNELFIGYTTVKDRRTPFTLFPQVTTTVPRVGGGSATIIGGADQFSQTNEIDVNTLELTENYSRNVGAHTLTFGTRNEYVKLRNLFNQSSFGVWSFRTLDSLQAGNANSFRKAIILREGGNVHYEAAQSAWYVQDQWAVTPRFSLTGGLRADVTIVPKQPVYNAAIDSAYGRRTSDAPSTTIQWSPRLGFNWDLTGDQINQLRGGLGLFVGTPPYVWLENAYVNSGNIITFLNCNTAGGLAPAPAFNPDPSGLNTCRDGSGTKPIGDVNFIDKNLKFPQPFRASLAFDRRIARDWVFTVEGLYSRTFNQLFFVNRNLRDVRGTDPHGRVLFGDTILTTTGAALPKLPVAVIANGGSSRFSTAIDLTNQNKDYAYSLTFQLLKRYRNDWQAQVAYTYARARDIQSFTSSTAISNWTFGRTLASDQFEPGTPTVSLFDQPHSIVAGATYTVHWWNKQLATDFTVFYKANSGSPHDYVYGAGASGSGDLNADARSGNDLIYVPKSALDPTEIQFSASGSITAATQAQAFENFINSSPCLKKYRGQILPRNACRVPWQEQMDLTIRQGLPEVLGGHRAALVFEVYNVMNLINTDWGKSKQTDGTTFNNVSILTHVGMTNVDPKVAVPIFRFNTNQRTYIKGNGTSDNWQFQAGFRYSF